MMIKTDSVRKERMTDCLTKRCDVILICLICRTDLFLWEKVSFEFLTEQAKGGTCSTLCDVSGACADLGRHASVEIGFLLEMMRRAVAGFHMESVFGGFSVRRVYDRFLYNRRADICAGNEPSENACILIWRLPRQRTVYCELASR